MMECPNLSKMSSFFSRRRCFRWHCAMEVSDHKMWYADDQTASQLQTRRLYLTAAAAVIIQTPPRWFGVYFCPINQHRIDQVEFELIRSNECRMISTKPQYQHIDILSRLLYKPATTLICVDLSLIPFFFKFNFVLHCQNALPLVSVH